ncbi:MAG TPA: S-layer protein, partial [Leptolyngbyaceae cyanobacterium M65_K2018_010]|nr:S-layer protein [Leptolyngbyaceae cyanobacterium M65_K2018_010]
YTAGYPGASDPAVGIFAATNQSYIAQISFIPEGFFQAAFAYMHNDGSDNFAFNNTGSPAAAGPVDTYAGLVNFDFGNFFIAGYGAFQSFEGGDDFNWTAGIGLNDLGFEGSSVGVYGGQLPQLRGYESNPWLIEGYWAIPFNRYLTVTPAIIYGDANLSGPDNTGWWGVVRATFTF